MPRPEKVQAVEEIREQLDGARATFVTEYRGLTVADQQKLRRNVKKALGEYRVLKMSLARLAVADTSLEGLTELLAGPTALAFANDDPVPVAKALREFASENDNLVIKGGVLAGALLPPEQVSRLAEIEPREVLLAKIAGGIKAPWAKLAGMLESKVRDAVSMFSQLLDKKEEEAPPAVEPVAAEEAPETEPEETAETAEETPEAETEAAPDAAETAAVEEVPEAEAAGVPEAEETGESEATPEAEAAPDATEIAETAEEAPASEAEGDAADAPEPEAEEKPVEPKKTTAKKTPAKKTSPKKTPPKKKAAPKAKAEESPAEAETEEPAEKSDDTAEEE